MLNILGPLLGLTGDQIQMVETDIDNIIRDFEAIEHGEIDVDSGLETLLLDLLQFLHDVGLVPDSESFIHAKGKNFRNGKRSIVVMILRAWLDKVS